MHRLLGRSVRREIYSGIDRIKFTAREEVGGRLPVTIYHWGLVGRHWERWERFLRGVMPVGIV